jgi:hypothetical protein
MQLCCDRRHVLLRQAHGHGMTAQADAVLALLACRSSGLPLPMSMHTMGLPSTTDTCPAAATHRTHTVSARNSATAQHKNVLYTHTVQQTGQHGARLGIQSKASCANGNCSDGSSSSEPDLKGTR